MTEPHNVEAEQQVLGALLASADADDAEWAAGLVSQAGGVDLFHDPMHAMIAKEVTRRIREGLAADAVALKPWASGQSALESVGGVEYLIRIQLSSLARSALADYCALLADLRRKRDVLAAIRAAEADLIADQTPTEQVAGQLEASLQSIDVPTARRPVSMARAVGQAVQTLHATLDGDRMGCISTGWRALDSMFGGFWPGEVTLLGGRPSMGKTAVALSVALNAARAGHKVAIFSLEMNPEQLALRAISEATTYSGSAIYYERIRRGEITDRELPSIASAAEQVGKLPITFLAREYADLGGLYSGASRARKDLGGQIDLLIVDYVQLINGDGRSRVEQITQISIALKSLAGRLNVPILALSQLSRAVESREDKRPQMSDLRESGQLEQDADAIMFCYRDEYYLQRQEPEDLDSDEHAGWRQAMERARHRIELIIAKQRQGAVGTAHLRCNPAANKIWED